MITAMLSMFRRYALGIIPFPNLYVTWFEHRRPESITPICMGTMLKLMISSELRTIMHHCRRVTVLTFVSARICGKRRWPTCQWCAAKKFRAILLVPSAHSGSRESWEPESKRLAGARVRVYSTDNFLRRVNIVNLARPSSFSVVLRLYQACGWHAVAPNGNSAQGACD